MRCQKITKNNALWSEMPNSRFIAVLEALDLNFNDKTLSVHDWSFCVIQVGRQKLVLNLYDSINMRNSNFSL